ncbi:GntR family transcriptional regulator [Oceaniglobus ichthyenteri]|uniref:GntR family transcriptional regulator n=1 Tax=Oceaniglobus ichthyenteri TaxID=2136177 RepID=UPI0013DE08B3|nr:GntR family transcriptional regulator [Oceaniglobus ichthyenteri]
MTDTFDTPDSPKRARRGPRSMQVADRLRERILAGEIHAGERVNEARLSLQLGVSRTPTRAALHALAAEGLLDYETNCGFTVRSYSDESIAEAFEIRAVLEGLACRLAAERTPDPAVTDAFRRALAQGDEIVAGFRETTAQMEAYRQMNIAFHNAVMAAAENQMLEETLRLALARPASSLRNIVSFTQAQIRSRHDDHHRIFDAIQNGEGWRAELLMREHVTRIKSSQVRPQTAP